MQEFFRTFKFPIPCLTKASPEMTFLRQALLRDV